MNPKDINYYLSLPYTIEFKQDTSVPNHPVWFAGVQELRGCITEADTLEEAAVMIRDAMCVWIAGSIEADLPIPEPESETAYSGKFSVRLPKSLHRDLVHKAQQEGVSLNQYVNSALSRVVGIGE